MSSPSTSALPPALSSISLTSKLLLSQAVLELGNLHWVEIANLLSASGRIPGAWTPEFCLDLYSRLMRQGQLDISKTVEPNSRTARKLVRLLQDARKAAIVLSLKSNTVESSAIQKEIQEINSGLHDESLISALPLQIRETLLDHPSTNSANEITKKPFVTSSVLPLLVPSLPSLPALPSLSLPADDEQVEADHTPDLVKEFTTTSLSPIPQPSTSSRRAKAQPALINSPPKPRASGRKVRKTIEATEAEEGEGAIADEEEEFEFELEDRKGKGRHVDIDPEPEPELEPEGEMEVEVDIEEEEEEGEGEGTGGEGEEGEEEEVEEGVVEVVKKRGRGKGRKGIVAPSKKATGSKRKQSESLDGDKKRAKTDETPEAEEERESLARAIRFKRGMNGVMKQMTDYPNAAAFLGPVRASDAPTYETAVKRSMSLREVSSRVKSGGITSAGEVQRDVALICANAVMFNDPELDVVRHARELWEYFGAQLQLFLATHQE